MADLAQISEGAVDHDFLVYFVGLSEVEIVICRAWVWACKDTVSDSFVFRKCWSGITDWNLDCSLVAVVMVLQFYM